jgi:cytochrome P450
MSETATAAGAKPYLDAEGHLLPEATFADQGLRPLPWNFYAAMRRDDPVHYDPSIDMYLVSRYEDLQKVFADPLTFSVLHGYDEQFAKGFEAEFKSIIQNEGGGYFKDAIMSDPPYHTRIRRLLESAFTAHRVKMLEPQIRDIAIEIIESVADKGKIDAVAEISQPYTIRVICKQLGFEHIDPRMVRVWSEAAVAQIGRMQDREEMLKHAHNYCDLQNFVIGLIEERRKNPTEDMISDLVHARIHDDENPVLDLGELVSLSRTLMVGGNDTTGAAVANLILALATNPEVRDQLKAAADDERVMNRFVEEFMRLEPSVHGLSRMTTREVELGGKVLPKGAHMLLLYGSGNDDESVFPDSRKFDINRPNVGRHVAFGGGAHRCVGMALARMEVKVAAQELIKRLDNFELEVPAQDLPYISVIALRGLASLPVKFTRRKDA